MSTLALLTLPFTIAATVIQSSVRDQQQQQQRLLQQNQLKVNQDQLELTQQEQTANLLANQQATRDALRAYYYKNGIDPTTGSAQNALNALATKNQQELDSLTQNFALKKKGLVSKTQDTNSSNDFNPAPDLFNLFVKSAFQLAKDPSNFSGATPPTPAPRTSGDLMPNLTPSRLVLS